MPTRGVQGEHAEFGRGTIVSVLGTEAEVDFFGEVLSVKTAELVALARATPKSIAEAESMSESALAFRQVFFGGYGTGKSHHLLLVKATALEHGWVTAFVEFDPKAADPAKPQLVYR